MITEELQVAGVVRRDQHLQKQPAEQRRENLDGKKNSAVGTRSTLM